MRRPRRWIQKALKIRPRRKGYGRHHIKSIRVEAAHKGALHRQLGVPVGKKIPVALLHEAAEHPERFFDTYEAQRVLQRRALFALNVRGLRHAHGRY